MLWLLIDAAQSIESLTKHSGRSVVTSVSYLARQDQHFNVTLSTSELPSPEYPRVTLDSQRVTTKRTTILAKHLGNADVNDTQQDREDGISSYLSSSGQLPSLLES
jgi:hypothetical protein